jgi:hypothetical protein
MPFTFSHPAIVLPLTLKKIRLSATGLIIGSMTPDFEYFIRMRNVSKYSHTYAGLFWFDLPLALLLCFIYHDIVRNSLFDNLPIFLKERFIIYKKFQWANYFQKNWVVVCISILIGATSHIVWDAFTHETLFFVEKDPELSTVMKVGTINLAGYKFLQLASSIVGLLVVIISIILLKKRPVVNKTINYRYWMIVVLIILSVMFMRFIGGLQIDAYRRVMVSFISSVIIALILTPMIISQQEQLRKDH